MWRVGATLRCSARPSHCDGFSCCGAWALGARASVVVAHGLSSCGSRALERRLSSCGAWAQLLHGMWDLPGPGLKPVSPALAGGFLTTAPPGKPCISLFFPSILGLRSPRADVSTPRNLKDKARNSGQGRLFSNTYPGAYGSGCWYSFFQNTLLLVTTLILFIGTSHHSKDFPYIIL